MTEFMVGVITTSCGGRVCVCVGGGGGGGEGGRESSLVVMYMCNADTKYFEI